MFNTPPRSFRAGVVVALAAFLSSCGAQKASRVFSEQGTLRAVSWSAEERAQDIALKTLRTTPEASYHLVRLRGAEEPHVHDQHDGVVFVLAGRIFLRLGERTLALRKGDVVEIPRGIVHQAVNLASEASLAYVVFTPPYDGSDKRIVPLPNPPSGLPAEAWRRRQKEVDRRAV